MLYQLSYSRIIVDIQPAAMRQSKTSGADKLWITCSGMQQTIGNIDADTACVMFRTTQTAERAKAVLNV
ncbi:hypothetical protein CRX72_05360 [Pantoea sp. BRM17]|nr:hypothetical protein CRX72_05360 [Pantoea sp. BRM17]